MQKMARSLKFLAVLAPFAFAASVQAHVRVLPFESKPGAHQLYTVKVPTEGTVDTTLVELEIPDGISVISASDQGEMQKIDGRTKSISWKVTVLPGQSKDLTFEAINPSANQDILWKAHQHYADGTSRDWVDLPKTKSPASVTRIGPTSD